MIYSQVEDIIGDTPLLKLDSHKLGLKNSNVYVKLEYLNPFGSVKDRTVTGMINLDTLNELAHKGASIIESSSGNTAKAMQVLASKYDVRFTSVTNRIKVPEVEDFLRYMGTDIVALPGRSECADPNSPDDAIGMIKRMIGKNPDAYFHTSQYTNPNNRLAHLRTTAHELYSDLSTIDIFATGVGTGGSSGGIIDYARTHNLETRFLGVMSEPSDFLPGIRTRRELFETELFVQDDFEELREISSLDALEALRDLVLNHGVLAGPTTGASFAALRQYLEEHDDLRPDGSRQTVVFIACDRLETYMSYIKKRQPELFGITNKTDVYSGGSDSRYDLPADIGTKQWIEDEAVLVVNTRGSKPFNAFHIKGSLSYPEEFLREVLTNGTPFSPAQKILVVCPTGERSVQLVNVLRKRGLEAYNLAGGLMAWKRQSLPFIRTNP